MDIKLSGIIKESIVDGKGMRYVVFTQGCPHGCKGCHNPQTHDFAGGTVYNTDKIVADFKKDPLLSGITLSGGEPVCQAEACMELAKGAKTAKLNVWMYSGYTYEEILSLASENNAIKELLNHVDVLVDGKFILEEKTLNLPFIGSRNQRVIDVKATLDKNEIVLYNPL